MEEKALQEFLKVIPATGEIDHAQVDNALRQTPEGRAARPYFHKLRRAGKFQTRIVPESGALMLSRVQSQAVNNG